MRDKWINRIKKETRGRGLFHSEKRVRKGEIKGNDANLVARRQNNRREGLADPRKAKTLEGI